MGRAQVTFAEVLWGATGSHVTRSDVTGSMFSACATGSGAISTLMGLFDRKWRQSRDQKMPCPEAVLIGSRFCACPAFSPRAFFLSSSTMATGCDQGSLDPFGFPWVCTCATPVVTEGHVTHFGSVLGVFSTTSASYDHRKPCVLYLAWWLELALVICPFYFHIVSI
jgi:hypothetical protein